MRFEYSAVAWMLAVCSLDANMFLSSNPEYFRALLELLQASLHVQPRPYAAASCFSQTILFCSRSSWDWVSPLKVPQLMLESDAIPSQRHALIPGTSPLPFCVLVLMVYTKWRGACGLPRARPNSHWRRRRDWLFICGTTEVLNLHLVHRVISSWSTTIA